MIPSIPLAFSVSLQAATLPLEPFPCLPIKWCLMKRTLIFLLVLFFSTHSLACGDTNGENTYQPGETGDGETGDGETDPCPEGEVEDPNTGECVTTTPETCAEINATECFSNYDCQDGFRCQDLSDEEMDVCCVPGDRGEGSPGEDCADLDGEAFCESAICIGNENFAARCSTTCETASDCPDSMQMCTPIAFSGSADDWCFPTE